MSRLTHVKGATVPEYWIKSDADKQDLLEKRRAGNIKKLSQMLTEGPSYSTFQCITDS